MAGKRGPRAQPTELRIARGNPGKRAINKDEPKPKSELPKCPVHLKGKAKEAWETFATQLTECHIAGDLDAVALELLCTSYALFIEASQLVVELGPVWMEKGTSKIPKIVYSPHWAVKNREWKNILSMLREFGMTPSSRSGVTKTSAGKPTGKFASFTKPA
jgi:P27 family predicted phage terminase small subunit